MGQPTGIELPERVGRLSSPEFSKSVGETWTGGNVIDHPAYKNGQRPFAKIPDSGEERRAGAIGPQHIGHACIAAAVAAHIILGIDRSALLPACVRPAPALLKGHWKSPAGP